MKSTIKTLTVRVPWSWLIVNGHKPIENRSWSTRYRGSLLIQSAAGYGSIAELDDLCLWVEQETGIMLPDTFDLGCTAGLVTLADVRTDQVGKVPFWPEPDMYHWILTNPIPLPSIPMRGKLGIWDFNYMSLEDNTTITTVKEYIK